MRSYINLNEELDKVLTTLEKIETELENILFPIKKIIEDNYSVLCKRFPVNVNISELPINRMIERIIMLRSDIIMFAIINNEEKSKINKIISQVINELRIILPEKEETANRKKELYNLINERKKYLQVKYEKLKNIDHRILNSKYSGNKKEYNEFKKYRKDIISDKELCEDLKILFDYNSDIDEYELKNEKEEIIITEIKDISDLYKLVDQIINNKVNEYMQYRYLPKNRIKEIKKDLKKCTETYVEGYVITNRNLTDNIEEFKNIINMRLSGELQEYFEIKNKLGVEYVTSKEEDKFKIVTIKEVIEGKYNGFESNIINKYATLLELSEVDEENLDVVRNFIINMGPEFLPIFNNLWIQHDTKRRRKIIEQKKPKNKKEDIN